MGAEVLLSPGPGLWEVFEVAVFDSRASDRDLLDRDESMSAFRLNDNYDIAGCCADEDSSICAVIRDAAVASNSETLSEEVSCSVLRSPFSFYSAPSCRDRGWKEG